MNVRRLLALALALLVVAPSGIARAANSTVVERGTQYVSAQITVVVGDTVSWIYESSPTGSPGHTVTFSDRDLNPNCPPQLLFNDCQRGPGDRVSRTFNTPGTYPYYCKIHRAEGMTGVVVVTAPTSSSSTAPKSTTTTARASSTTTTARATSSSTTSTTRQLATSSTVVRSSTTTSDTSSALEPGAPPALSGDSNSAAGGGSGGSGGSDRGVVALIVGLLLAVSAAGGYLLWRLRPGRS
jgi:plastocyanin